MHGCFYIDKRSDGKMNEKSDEGGGGVGRGRWGLGRGLRLLLLLLDQR